MPASMPAGLATIPCHAALPYHAMTYDSYASFNLFATGLVSYRIPSLKDPQNCYWGSCDEDWGWHAMCGRDNGS